MDKKEFSLDTNNSNKFLRVSAIIFGIMCIALAIIWLVINLNKGLVAKESVYPIVFIILFGIYQVSFGLGKTSKYINIGTDGIQCKQHSILPAKHISPSGLDKIEIFPLSVHFHGKNSKKFIFRFGTSYREIIEPVKSALADFAESNGIEVEYGIEEI